MALISMGESRWRMLRRVLRKKKFQYGDCRNMSRNDEVHFEWMIQKGFFKALSDDWYEVTEKGKEAADLGLYEV